MRYKGKLLTLALLAPALLVAGCNQSQAAKEAATGTAGSVAPRASLLTVPPDQMGHVQVVAAKQTTWTRQLRLTGNVTYNQFHTTQVVSQVSGPVAKVMVVPGEEVRRGQPLLEVASPDFAQARSTYLKAHDAFSLAQKVYQRDQELYQHQAIALADLQAAESSQTQAQADLQTAEQGLRILGVTNPASTAQNSPTALLPLRAPLSGTLVERDVTPGQLLQGGATQCFVISNMSTVWVLANVYQNDMPYVHVGDPVTISTDAYPQPFRGRIQFISPALDPNSRTLQARIETRNPRGELKKDMYVTATVQAGIARHVIVVPNAAVLRDAQNVPFVYVQSGKNNQFAQHTVSIGDSENGSTEITSGLQAGDMVVGDGSLFLQFANSFQN